MWQVQAKWRCICNLLDGGSRTSKGVGVRINGGGGGVAV